MNKVVIPFILVFFTYSFGFCISLEYKYKKGDVNRYEETYEMKNQNVFGKNGINPGPSIKGTIAFSETVTEMGKGYVMLKCNANIKTFTVNNKDMRSNVKDKYWTFFKKINRQGRVLALLDENKKPISDFNIDFDKNWLPNKSVEVGDVWNASTVIKGGYIIPVKCKLKKVYKNNGFDMALISVNFDGRFPVDDMYKLLNKAIPIGPNDVLIAKGEGDYIFDATNGKMVSFEYKVFVEIKDKLKEQVYVDYKRL